MLAAIATAAGDLAARDVQPTGAVLNGSTYWLMPRQGADAAGFYVSGTGDRAVPGVRPGTLVTPFGIPVVPDSSIASDDLIVSDYSTLKVYTGAEPAHRLELRGGDALEYQPHRVQSGAGDRH